MDNQTINDRQPKIICRDKKTELKNGIYTNCEGCPCLNSDYEQGAWCNLNYDSDLFWLKTDDLRNVSANCGLTKIIYIKQKTENGITYKQSVEFSPDKFEIQGS